MENLSESDKLRMYEMALGLLDESKPGYDPVRGAGLMLQAAEAGIVMAQVQYGVLYYYGKGVPKDHEAAFSWYARSLETGGYSWGGGFNIGDLHDDSDEFPKNPIEAAAWFVLSLQMKQGPERLTALLLHFGQADVARVVARTMTIIQMMQDKKYDERLRPMRGLSLEPPEGPCPDETPVTILSILIPLHAALASNYSLERLMHELRYGDSMLYGAFKLLNAEDHAKGQMPMVEPQFIDEATGEPTALLYSCRFDFIFDKPSENVTQVAMTSQKYFEMLLDMGVKKLRLNQALFGEVSLDLSEVLVAVKGSATIAEKELQKDELDGTMPDPPPFKVSFQQEGKTYVAHCFPEASHRQKVSSDESQIVEFGPNVTILRVTCGEREQESPERFAEAVVNHLNRSPGMRDGDFPASELVSEETFWNIMIIYFRQNVRLVRVGDWEIKGSTNVPRFVFVAMERENPNNAVFFKVEPRSRIRAGFATAFLKIREAHFERLKNVIENEHEFMAGLFQRLKVAPEITAGTWFETDGVDEATGNARRKYPDSRGDHPLLKFHMDNGLSSQSEEGAERMANVMARLFLLIQELERYSISFQNREN